MRHKIDLGQHFVMGINKQVIEGGTTGTGRYRWCRLQ